MLLTPLLSLFAPHDCIGCGAEGRLMCNICIDSLSPAQSRCYRCMAPSRDSVTCPRCRLQSALTAVYPVTQYQGLAKEVIWKLKFGRARAAASEIGTLMVARLALYLDFPTAGPTIVTYVPTATTRVRQRGYDQARLIARAFAAASGLSCQTLLARHGHHKQVGANRDIRITQLQDDFRAVNPKLIRGASIILVDDVVTTGATLQATAAVLQAAGARSIRAAVFAQA